jgi:hypothetical protein
MNHRNTCATLLLGIITFGLCSTANANSTSPLVYYYPGAAIMPLYAFTASLLAAFIERPFLTAAGVRYRALTYSLRANFFSTLVGILISPVGLIALYVVGPLAFILTFLVSSCVKIFYLRRHSHQRFDRSWVVGGNALSSAMLVFIPAISSAIELHWHRLTVFINAHLGLLTWALFLGSLAVFVASFLRPGYVSPHDRPAFLLNTDAAIGGEEPVGTTIEY